MSTEPRLPTNAGHVDWAGPDSYFYAMSGLIHAVRLPQAAKATDPAPVAVLVHGWGGDESVMWLFKQTLPSGVAVITPRAPLALDNEPSSPGESGFIWYQRDEAGYPDPKTKAAGLAKFEHFITTLPDLYPVDPDRLLLMGFSQGGAMCNGLALTRPELMLGVASLAGFIPELPEGTSPVESLNGLPVFVAHGIRDETVPIRAAWKVRDTYEAAGADLTYAEYDVGHKMTSRGLRELTAWVGQVFAGRDG